jgi:hypothetical protein
LLVTPGVYQRDTEFLEYTLFQIIDTLLGGGKQKGFRPLEYVGEELVRKLLVKALNDLSTPEKLSLFPASGIGRWAQKLGWGQSAILERVQLLIDALHGRDSGLRPALPIRKCLADSGLSVERATELVVGYIERTESHNTAGLMRRAMLLGFVKSVLGDDESELAGFLTYGFAELKFQVRPTRQDLVLSLLKVLMDVFRSLKIPVVVAFDQLEDLLLSRRSDDAHKIAESFFAGIVQVMHQIDGLCFLIFAERGLWNRFIPSLDGYIQDRLNNPVHVPNHGTVKAVRLESPPFEMVRRVVEARLRPTIEELPDFGELSEIFPFTDDQVQRIARTEPTLRDMLQQFRHLFDHVVYGSEEDRVIRPGATYVATRLIETERATDYVNMPVQPRPRITESVQELPTLSTGDTVAVKSIVVVESPAVSPVAETDPIAEAPAAAELPRSRDVTSRSSLAELWEQEFRSARRKLEPDGALTGATRELQSALGAFLQTAHEHGVKVGPWRLQHVVPEWTFGEHPTYGAVSLGHWACKDGQPWKVGIGLFLGRGAGKPKDLEIKLQSMETDPPVIDHLILLRPEDDLLLSGKSKTLWQDAERRSKSARMEPMSLDGYAALYAFPRWLSTILESLPEGQPLPNLADIMQEKCEKLLEQVCMPVQG